MYLGTHAAAPLASRCRGEPRALGNLDEPRMWWPASAQILDDAIRGENTGYGAEAYPLTRMGRTAGQIQPRMVKELEWRSLRVKVHRKGEAVSSWKLPERQKARCVSETRSLR